MRLQLLLRALSTALVAGTLGIVITMTAAAPATAQTDTKGVKAAVEDRKVKFGGNAIVRGRVVGAAKGSPVTLEVRRAGSGAWKAVKTVTTGKGGRYRVGTTVHRNGRVRVVSGGAQARARAEQGVAPAPAVSAARKIRVRARLVTGAVKRHVTAGNRVKVRGGIRPRGGGRVVALQLRRNGTWRTVDRDRTSRKGRFTLRETLRGTGSSPARVRFRGDKLNAAAKKGLGRVNAYRYAHASWYGPGLYGNPLGCGGRLYPGTVGVAHKSLPCGTKLTLRYRGNVVRARVIDRGPYIAGREFDLTAATKSKLGFGDLGNIQVAH